MLTTKEATDLQNLLQLMVYYIDLFDLGDLGANTSEKRKALAMAAIRQLSAKIVSLTQKGENMVLHPIEQVVLADVLKRGGRSGAEQGSG